MVLHSVKFTKFVNQFELYDQIITSITMKCVHGIRVMNIGHLTMSYFNQVGMPTMHVLIVHSQFN